MPNPYEDLDEMYFWKKAVAEQPADAIFPVQSKAFRLNPADKVVTAGSCFAQNVGKYLRQDPTVTLLETEALGAEDPVFSGRYCGGAAASAQRRASFCTEISAALEFEPFPICDLQVGVKSEMVNFKTL